MAGDFVMSRILGDLCHRDAAPADVRNASLDYHPYYVRYLSKSWVPI